MEATAHILVLPYDIQAVLLSFLSLKELFASIPLVCKSWNQLISSGAVFSKWPATERNAAASHWMKVSRLFDREDHHQKLVYAATNVLKIDPSFQMAYFARDTLERYEQAAKDYAKSIELDPKHVQSYNNLGFAVGRLKRYEEALTWYQKALELADGKYKEAWSNMGFTYSRLNNLPKSIECYTKAIQVDGSYGLAYSNRAFTYIQMGDYNNAVVDCKEALRVSPHNARAHCHLATSLLHLGNLVGAQDSASSAIKLEPSYPRSFYVRGCAYQATHEYQSAIQDFQAFLNLKPDETIYPVKEAVTALAQCQAALSKTVPATSAVGTPL